MKVKTYFKVAITALLAGSPLLWSACTDAWDDHYGVGKGGFTDQPTLLENIAADSKLANFYKVVKAIGGEETLASPQLLTVWAPLGLTDEQADSIIAVYQSEVAQGRKWDKNKAVTQFLQNHMALYARPISSQTDSLIALANGKYMTLKGTSATTGSLDGNPFNETVLCGNGILYKTERVQTFFPNVREYLEQAAGSDTLDVMKFIYTFDEEEIDENSSVPGGVKDGETFYLDSVMILNNTLLRDYKGFIDREDSVYMFLAPTDEVWTSLFEKYRKYLKYPNITGMNVDSLTDLTAKMYILNGRFFNRSNSNRYNAHPQDSLVSTSYNEEQQHYPRKYVYYNPFDAGKDGILAGLEKVECSNGEVYIDNKGVIDPASTFFGRMDMNATNENYYEIPKKDEIETMNVNNLNAYEDSVWDATTEKMKLRRVFRYVEVAAKSSIAHSQLTYTLPGTMSDVYYNVYLVTTPDEARKLPSWFRVSFNEKGANNEFARNNTPLVNPHPVTADGDVPNANIITAQANPEYCFVTSGEKVDTILIQTAMQFKFAHKGLEGREKGGVSFDVQSWGPGGQSYQDKYTRTLRLNEFILVPFETEAEAKAAADDLDAFNDDILMEKAKQNASKK